MIEHKLTRTLFYNSNLEVKSFATLPKMIKSNYAKSEADGLNLSVISNCYLILKFTGNPSNTDYASKRYTMSLKNRRATQRFFSSILNWLEDPQYEDMFFYSQDHILEFNYDYKDLSITTPFNKNCQYVMEARPIIYEDSFGSREGVLLTFNLHENTVAVSWEDFVVIADIVLNFDFEVESLLLVNSYMTSCQLDRISTPDQERMNRRIERGSRDPFH